MKRDVIQIDREKCIGCAQCVNTCHQGALALVDGKAMLVSEDYCDGLGLCLPECPSGALSIVQKEIQPEDMKKTIGNPEAPPVTPPTGGCPGAMARSFVREPKEENFPQQSTAPVERNQSQLTNWPVQLGLVPVRAPYLDGADLLIAADCTAFTYANFHEEFLKGKVCLIGCPKLDRENYSEKLTAMLQENDIQSITILRMEVPCCSGLVAQVKTALANSGKVIPWGYRIVSLEGELLP